MYLEVRIGYPALVIKLDDFFQRLEAAVVHIGTVQSDAAQSRRLVFAAVSVGLRHRVPTEVRATPAHAGVMKRLVGKILAAVALPALALAFVKPQTMALGGGHRFPIA